MRAIWAKWLILLARSAPDPKIADQAIESAAQVGTGHHGVADHVKTCRPHHLVLGKRDRGIAGALDRDLPEMTDLFRRRPRTRPFERSRIDPHRGVKAATSRPSAASMSAMPFTQTEDVVRFVIP